MVCWLVRSMRRCGKDVSADSSVTGCYHQAMFRAFVLAVGLATGVQDAARISDLTVPAERLPSGCVLSPTPTAHIDGNRIRSGLSAGSPSNPWIGTDAVRIASIAQLFFDPPRMPDGPPLDKKEIALFNLRYADGIDQAYEAVYLASDSAPLIIVYGLQFPSATSAGTFWSNSRVGHDPHGFKLGPTVALIAGPDSDCTRAVAAYLSSLVRQ